MSQRCSLSPYLLWGKNPFIFFFGFTKGLGQKRDFHQVNDFEEEDSAQNYVWESGYSSAQILRGMKLGRKLPPWKMLQSIFRSTIGSVALEFGRICYLYQLSITHFTRHGTRMKHIMMLGCSLALIENRSITEFRLKSIPRILFSRELHRRPSAQVERRPRTLELGPREQILQLGGRVRVQARRLGLSQHGRELPSQRLPVQRAVEQGPNRRLHR